MCKKILVYKWLLFLFTLIVSFSEILSYAGSVCQTASDPLQMETPSLFLPGDQSTMQSTEYLQFEWNFVSASDGEVISYDLYFGDSPAPPLYRENISDGWVSDDGLEFAFKEEYDNAYYLFYMNTTTTLQEETTYYWKVVAKNSLGESKSSETFSFITTRQNTLPTPPVMLSPQNNATGVLKTVTLHWTASTDADGDPVTYDLYFGKNKANPHSQQLIQTGLTSNSYIFPYDLDDQETYFWKVHAIDGYNGDAVTSDGTNNTWKFTVENYFNDPPGAVSLVFPTSESLNTGTTIAFDWSDASDKDGDALTYYFFLDTDPNPTTLIGKDIEASSFRYTVANAYQTYYWKVLVYDGVNFSASSGVRSFKPYQANTAPTLLLPSGITNITKRPALSWSSASRNPNELVLYDVYLDTKQNPQTIVASNLRDTVFSPVLGNGTMTYYWKIVAKTSIGQTFETPVSTFVPWENGHSTLTVNLTDIEAGSFRMGDSEYAKLLPGLEPYGPQYMLSSTPQHTVFLDNYSINKYEITFAQFLQFLEATRNSWHIDEVNNQLIYDVPVISNWENGKPVISKQVALCIVKSDATPFDFTKHSKLLWNGSELTIKPGFEQYAASWITADGASLFADWAGLRLPTEAEWDFAAHGGNLTKNYIYSGSNNVNECAWYLWGNVNYDNPMTGANNGNPDRDNKGTNKVGLKKANELGLYDMSGNVLEYCSDNYDIFYYINSETVNPLGSDNGTSKVCRGGGFESLEHMVFTNNREEAVTYRNYWNNGIRPAGNHSASGTIIIQGTVRDRNKQPQEGITIACGSVKTTTNKNGKYQFRVTKGDSVVILPSHSDFTFSPASLKLLPLQLASANFNFTAIPDPDYCISGKVTDPAWNGIPGIEISGLPEKVVTDNFGQYKAFVPKGKDYRLMVAKPGYAFTPQFIDINNIQSEVPDADFMGTNIGTVTIWGLITRIGGIGGESHILIGGLPGAKVYTDSNGYYTAQVTKGWSGKLSPIDDNLYSFGIATPISVSISNIQADTRYDFGFSPKLGHSFTGKVEDILGNPVEGIEIVGFDDKFVKTNVSGIFGVKIAGGCTKVIAPVSDNFTFTPAGMEVYVSDGTTPSTNAVFIAHPKGDYRISGKINNSNGFPVQGVNISGFEKTVETTINGEYEIRVNADFSGAIKPFLQGYSFTPEEVEISALNSDFTQNFVAGETEIFSVTGKVSAQGGNPLHNATIKWGASTTTTNANGEYTFTEAKGWTGSIVPEMDGYIFSPEKIDIASLQDNLSGNNFTAIPVIKYYTVSGTIADSEGNLLPDIGIDGFSGNITTDGNGTFQSGEQAGWSGNITPSSGDYTFDPVSWSITDLQKDSTIRFTAQVVTSVFNPARDREFSVFPNPSSNGEFEIQFEGDKRYVQIFSPTGSMIFCDFITNHQKIHLNNKGLFLIKIHTGDAFVIKRIVIQ